MPAAAPVAAAPAAAEEAPAEEKPKEKTMFNVKLESFNATAKPKIIREVKAMIPNLTLIDVRPPFLSQPTLKLNNLFLQAKKFVESLPKVLKEGLNKEDAEKLQKTFVDLGAVIILE